MRIGFSEDAENERTERAPSAARCGHMTPVWSHDGVSLNGKSGLDLTPTTYPGTARAGPEVTRADPPDAPATLWAYTSSLGPVVRRTRTRLGGVLILFLILPSLRLILPLGCLALLVVRPLSTHPSGPPIRS